MSRNMEFVSQNYLNTTTMVTVDSGTGTVQYLFDRNLSLEYQSSGYTAGTSTTMNIVFNPPQPVSRILVQNHNLKDFSIYYNSNAANVFTPAIAVTQNSDTSSYYAVSTVTVDSIQIKMDDVMDSGNEERTIGEIVIGDAKVSFDYNPSTDNYDPQLYKQKIKHTMPDGGTNLFIVGNKFQANITLKFIGETFRDALKGIYDDAAPVYFIPEPTSSGWAGEAREVVYVNNWDFTYAVNSKEQGYNGKITIEETPSA